MKVKYFLITLITLYRLLAVESRSTMALVAESNFTSSISVDKERYNSGEEIKLSFKLVNNNKYDVYVLVWHTPLEGFLNNFLEVKHDGKELGYKGFLVKRGDPSEESYVLVIAGKSVDADVILNEAYDVTDPGHYTVKLLTELKDVIVKQGESVVPRKLDCMHPVALSSGPIQFNIVA